MPWASCAAMRRLYLSFSDLNLASATNLPQCMRCDRACVAARGQRAGKCRANMAERRDRVVRGVPAYQLA